MSPPVRHRATPTTLSTRVARSTDSSIPPVWTSTDRAAASQSGTIFRPTSRLGRRSSWFVRAARVPVPKEDDTFPDEDDSFSDKYDCSGPRATLFVWMTMLSPMMMSVRDHCAFLQQMRTMLQRRARSYNG